MTTPPLLDAILAGDRRALARAITLLESTQPAHRPAAAQLLQAAMPYTGNSLRIGISGAPGVGKSTFIEALGRYIVEQGQRIAVLSVDPSSSISGGSILGDKTRMAALGNHPQAYIRPSPAAGTLGGVARRTREALLLCEAAGFDVLVVETVGVGQSEVVVSQMSDVFVLLLLPQAGDELQGIKRGIMELADVVLINKADGPLQARAQQAVAEVRQALRLNTPRLAEWQVPVLAVSALKSDNIAAAWQAITDYQRALTQAAEWQPRRAAQRRHWLWEETRAELLDAFRHHPAVAQALPALEQDVVDNRRPATAAAQQLVEIFLHARRSS